MRTNTLILAVVAAATLPALAGDTPEPATIRGEVVASRSAPATAQEGRCLEVQVRQQNQERTWIRLRDRDRLRDGTGDGQIDGVRARDRSRDRIHTPGSGGGNGSGARRGGR